MADLDYRAASFLLFLINIPDQREYDLIHNQLKGPCSKFFLKIDVLTFIKGGVSDSGERPVRVFDDYLSPQLLTAPF